MPPEKDWKNKYNENLYFTKVNYIYLFLESRPFINGNLVIQLIFQQLVD